MSSLEILRALFEGDIVTPHDTDYEEAISRWAVNAERRAAVVAFVRTPEDVALAIKYARAAGLRIAIRGGGHSAGGGSSSEGGLVIDLSRHLNNVRVDPDKRLIYVQGGAVWKTVDEAAIKHGLAGVGGTVNHTGVGGLSVGGGYGWLSGAHGLVIDNTVQVTVVTADGRVLDANDAQNVDIFWGVRGGGSNFGIVTEFVFKLHPQRATVFAGPVVFPAQKCEDISAFLDQWWPNAKPDEAILVSMTRGRDGNPVIVTILFHNGSEEDGRKRYKALLDIGPVADLAKEIPYEELNALNNANVEWGAGYYLKGALLSSRPSEDINQQKLARILAIGDGAAGFSVSVLHEYTPHKKINSVPADATPYRRDLTGNALIVIRWEDHIPEKTLQAREIAHALAEMAPQGEPYGNYNPDSDALPAPNAAPTDKAKSMFREHYPRLQAIKQKYDPDMIFNQVYTIVPA